MKIVVAGGRDFENKQVAFACLDEQVKAGDTIISGHARGADTMGELYAEEHGNRLEKYPADWNKYGRSAGYIRNSKMASVADKVVAFWDGKSRGTQHMINIAKNKGLELTVYDYNGRLTYSTTELLKAEKEDKA